MRKAIIVPYRLKPALVPLGWGTSIAAITLWAVFQGLLLPRIQGGSLPPEAGEPWRLSVYYICIFGVSVVSAFVVGEFGKAIASFLVSYGLGAVITYGVLALPAFVGAGVDLAQREILVKLAVDITFRAFFPIPLLLELLATFLGVGLVERLA